MFKKFLIAVAVTATLGAAASLVTAAPAAAEPGWGGGRPGHTWHPRDPGGRWNQGPRHHWRGGYYGGYRAYPPGVYGFYGRSESCWLTQRRVRVLTDYGWRLRWRTVRVCN